MFLIMFVLDEPDRLQSLLKAWEESGIRGATIIESTGIHRVKRISIPLRYLFQTGGEIEQGNYTLFVIVENEQTVRDCLEATEKLIGNLDLPNTGVFAAWPLSIVKGLPPIDSES